MIRARLALNALRARAHELPGEWPMVLHMLEGHAPRFFAEQRLGEELARVVEGLDAVPLELHEDLDPDTAMTRADAWWVKARRGRPLPPLDVVSANACIDAVELAMTPLHGWVMAEQLGLPRTYERGEWIHDMYWLTHRVLFDTGGLAQPPVGLDDVLDELHAGLPQAADPQLADLYGEMLFCLQVGRRDVGAEVERFAQLQNSDGSFLDAHCTAVGLVVLAHAGL